jgi:transposase IS116/IS110/IS902 family protein
VHYAVRQEPLAHRLAAIKTAGPFTPEQAVRQASVLLIKALATHMKTAMEAIPACDHESEKRCRTPQDFPLLASRPGAGPVYAARLTAALGTARGPWTTVEELLCFAGVAPVLERRGKATWIRGRSFGPKFLRQSCHD